MCLLCAENSAPNMPFLGLFYSKRTPPVGAAFQQINAPYWGWFGELLQPTNAHFLGVFSSRGNPQIAPLWVAVKTGNKQSQQQPSWVLIRDKQTPHYTGCGVGRNKQR